MKRCKILGSTVGDHFLEVILAKSILRGNVDW
jgi:hypothetical protein